MIKGKKISLKMFWFLEKECFSLVIVFVHVLASFPSSVFLIYYFVGHLKSIITSETDLSFFYYLSYFFLLLFFFFLFFFFANNAKFS